MKHLTFLFLIIISASALGARTLPTHLKKDWKEKTVFFGVNKAWDYLLQEHTTLAYLARDEVFDYEGFSEEKYWQGLQQAREMGLKFAGISQWTIEKKSLEKRGPQEVLIKIEGTYLAKRGKVHFVEWQHFKGEEYHQATLTENHKSYRPVPKAQIPAIFSAILQINQSKGGRP